MSISPTISKSQYLVGLRCHKELWLRKHRKDLAPEITPEAQARFDTGNEIGILATKCFDNGIEVTNAYNDIENAILATQKYVAQGYEHIFEATAMNPNDRSYSRIDILQRVPNTDTWNLIEVKSTTSIRTSKKVNPPVEDKYLNDVAFQYYVFTGAGYKIAKTFLMFIDNTYVKQGEVDPHKLFRKEDITNEILAHQNNIEQQISKLNTTLKEQDEPCAHIQKKICLSDFPCDYWEHCSEQAQIPEYSTFKLFNSRTKVFKDIEEKKMYRIEDLSEDYIEKAMHPIDIKTYLEKTPHIDKEAIQTWLNELQMPIYFLDYETVKSAIPLFDGTRSSQQIPFQFSLDIEEVGKAKLSHKEFLHKEHSDPREPFIKALIDACGTNGTILTYNMSFERSCTQKLAEAFPQYAKPLQDIIDRMVDLEIPFSKRWLYSPEQKSSTSIKKVLPAYTDFKYDNMEIGNGSEAMNKYHDFIIGKMSADDSQKLFKNLRDYCALDTIAMVKLLEKLRELVK